MSLRVVVGVLALLGLRGLGRAVRLRVAGLNALRAVRRWLRAVRLNLRLAGNVGIRVRATGHVDLLIMGNSERVRCPHCEGYQPCSMSSRRRFSRKFADTFRSRPWAS